MHRQGVTGPQGLTAVEDAEWEDNNMNEPSSHTSLARMATPESASGGSTEPEYILCDTTFVSIKRTGAGKAADRTLARRNA